MAIPDRRFEWRALPCRFRATRHHVGMTQEGQRRSLLAVGRPQVVYLAVAQMLHAEPCPREAFADMRQATCVFRGYRAPTDQVDGKLKDVAVMYRQFKIFA